MICKCGNELVETSSCYIICSHCNTKWKYDYKQGWILNNNETQRAIEEARRIDMIWEKRREEIKNAWNYKRDTETFGEFIDKIIEQEKEILRKFADQLYDEISFYYMNCNPLIIGINKLLSERNIEEI